MDFYNERFNERLYTLIWRGNEPEWVDLPSMDDLNWLIVKILEKESPLTLGEIRRRIAEYYWLTDDDVYKTTEFGSTPILGSRINTVIRRLMELFLIERREKGTYTITNLGKQAIKAYPDLTEEDLHDIRRWLFEHFNIWCDENGNIAGEVENIPYTLEELPAFNPHYEENQPVEECYNLSFREIEILYNSDLRFRKILNTGFIQYKDGSLYIAVPVWNYEERRFDWYFDENIPETRLSFQKNYRSNTIQFMGFSGDSNGSRKEFYEAIHRIYKKTPRWADESDPAIISVIYGIILDIDAAEDGYEALKMFLRNHKVTQSSLAEELDLEERTVRRLLNKETTLYLDRLVECCLVLKLPYDISKALIDKFDLPDKEGRKYEPHDGYKHEFWEFLLKFGQNMTKEEINKLSEKKGFGKIFRLKPDIF